MTTYWQVLADNPNISVKYMESALEQDAFLKLARNGLSVALHTISMNTDMFCKSNALNSSIQLKHGKQYVAECITTHDASGMYATAMKEMLPIAILYCDNEIYSNADAITKFIELVAIKNETKEDDMYGIVHALEVHVKCNQKSSDYKLFNPMIQKKIVNPNRLSSFQLLRMRKEMKNGKCVLNFDSNVKLIPSLEETYSHMVTLDELISLLQKGWGLKSINKIYRMLGSRFVGKFVDRMTAIRKAKDYSIVKNNQAKLRINSLYGVLNMNRIKQTEIMELLSRAHFQQNIANDRRDHFIL